MALSDPPFYTACPNPYIKQFIEEYGKPYDPNNDDYNREPFVGDVSEGKNDPIYQAHSYHTKVPYKAIVKFIKHYTKPGDIVSDGFCGSGMTGIAAQMTGRYAILSDVSPVAGLIAYNYNFTIDYKQFEKRINVILDEIEKEYGWMYETSHVNAFSKNELIAQTNEKVKINHVVWSNVFICPYCKKDLIFWDVAIDKKTKSVKKLILCPNCNVEISIRDCERAKITFFDSIIRKEITQTKQIPVLISYSVGKKVFEKKPDKIDINLINEIQRMENPYWFPTEKIMFKGHNWGDKWRKGLHFGLANTHHFFTKRSQIILSIIKNKINSDLFLLELICNDLLNFSILRRYKQGILPLAFYVPNISQELNIFRHLRRRVNRLAKIYEKIDFNKSNAIISTQSLTDFKNIDNNSVDYIFTDPPFGDNIFYSELNFIEEAFLRVYTNNLTEAIISKSQRKDLSDYKKLMLACFENCYRILKPNRWMTVVFHNSKASVWNAIQESITKSGFIIAQVTTLDKKQGSFNQVTSSAAVKNDLIINAYKPKTEFSERFLKNAGEGMEIDFVIQQLEHLPVKPNIERTEKMLYSKMLAHYVENGFKIKYDSTNFYKLLSDNFTELDGNWFLDNQVKEYNKWKSGLSLEQIKNVLDGQQVLFVSDEKSALAWLYNFLHQPKTYSEIYTAYQKVATTTDDKIPELKELLDNNFIVENGKHRRPISREERENINNNRERELDRAFQKLLKQAREQKGRIRNVRREALIHGFTKCYQEGRYQDILTVADKLYASTLEASGDIMDFVDIARIKTSGEERKQRTINNEFLSWR
ncbi:MAG: DNA methyltransferase [Candidatus Hodarchaeales archaeon]